MKSIALICLLLTGCTHTSYIGVNGERFSRWQLGSLTAVGRLKITPQTNAPPIVELEGYNNDSLQAIGAVTEAAVRGAVKSVAP